MKNPNSKGKLRAVLKAAILGALLFIGVSLTFLIGDHIWQHSTNTFLNVFDLIVDIPSMLVLHIAGMENNALAQTSVFGLVTIINGLFGAFAFAVVTACWQFIVKGKPENKNGITGI